MSFEEILKIIKAHGLESNANHHGLKQWHLPFIIKKWRSDVAVTFYALNIYPENIKAGLESENISKLVSGKFFAFNKTFNKNRDHRFFINVELAPGKKPQKTLLQKISKSVFSHLLKLNIEYRKLHSIIGNKAIPKLTLLPFDGRRLVLEEKGGVFSQKGKKAKIVS